MNNYDDVLGYEQRKYNAKFFLELNQLGYDELTLDFLAKQPKYKLFITEFLLKGFTIIGLPEILKTCETFRLKGMRDF